MPIYGGGDFSADGELSRSRNITETNM